MDTVVYALDGKGARSSAQLSEINPDGLFWVRTNTNDISAVLTQLSEAKPITQRVLAAKETRPRALVYDDALLATLRCVKVDNKHNTEKMISIRLYIRHNLIITVEQDVVDPIQKIESSLGSGCGVKSEVAFLEKLLTLITEGLLDVTSILGGKLDKVEDTLSDEVSKKDRSALSAVRRRIILLSRYITPQREAISRVSMEKISWFADSDYINLRETSDACTRLLENIRNEEERATVIHEEFYAYAQENLNQKMYLLTIIASIFMPLTFITGLLGINVGGIPGATYKYGFAAVCLVLIIIFVAQYLWLKKRKWFD